MAMWRIGLGAAGVARVSTTTWSSSYAVLPCPRSLGRDAHSTKSLGPCGTTDGDVSVDFISLGRKAAQASILNGLVDPVSPTLHVDSAALATIFWLLQYVAKDVIVDAAIAPIL